MSTPGKKWARNNWGGPGPILHPRWNISVFGGESCDVPWQEETTERCVMRTLRPRQMEQLVPDYTAR